MITAIDTKHLRHVGLSISEVKTISFLAQHGGDVAWHPHAVKSETQHMIEALQTKHLVLIAVGHLGQLFLRLTDQGRVVADQLAAMDAAPKIHVAL